MAVTKFVRAQDILKEKGFKAPPFDTAGFQNAVVEFFRKNDVSAKLAIFGVRFVDYKGTPKCGFSDCTQYRSSETWSDGSETFHYDLPDYLDCRFGYSTAIGFSSPFFIVDEPYLTNAVALLKMAGFIAGRKRRVLGVPTYDITLV